MRSHFQDLAGELARRGAHGEQARRLNDDKRTPGAGAEAESASTIDDLPKPIPQFIDLGDYFIRSPRLWDGEVDIAAFEMTLAMTPDERLRWHQCWCKFIEEAIKRGEDIGELVYGQPCPYESS
jgi:hypothetical protein